MSKHTFRVLIDPFLREREKQTSAKETFSTQSLTLKVGAFSFSFDRRQSLKIISFSLSQKWSDYCYEPVSHKLYGHFLRIFNRNDVTQCRHTLGET